MRDWFKVGSLVGIVLLALLFDSNTSGIMALFTAALTTLILAAVFLTKDLPGWLVQNPAQGLYCAVVVIVLVVLYQFSQSADNSFGPTWLLCIALLVYLVVVTASVNQQEKLWLALVVLIAASAGYSIWNFVVNDVRAAWPVGDANNYASLLYLVWVPWLHRYLVKHPKYRPYGWAALLGTVLASVAMYTTESRAGVALMLVAFAIWLGLSVARKLTWQPLVAHFASSVTAFVGSIFLLGAQGIAPDSANTIEGGLGVRLQLALAALKLYPEHPVAGFGLNAFSALYAARRPVTDQVTAGRLVHNDYLQFLIEGGPLLLVALLTLAGFAAFTLWKCVTADKDSPAFMRAGFALAGCLLLAHALVNFAFYRFTLPVLLAVVLAMAHSATVASTSSVALKGVAQFFSDLPKGWLWAPLLGGGLAFGYLVVDVVTAGVIGGQDSVPFTKALRRNPESVHQWARIAQSLNADRGLPLLADASISASKVGEARPDERQQHLSYVVAKFRQALQVDPWNTNAYMEFYRFLQQYPSVARDLPEWEQPVNLLLRAVSLNRQFVPALDELLRITQSRPREHEKLLTTLVAPWLELIARLDLPAARRYLEALRGLLPAAQVRRYEVLFEGLARRKGLHQRSR